MGIMKLTSLNKNTISVLFNREGPVVKDWRAFKDEGFGSLQHSTSQQQKIPRKYGSLLFFL